MFKRLGDPYKPLHPLSGVTMNNNIHLLTYSIQHSRSWEANRCVASLKIPRTLRNPKVDYRIQKCPPPLSRDSTIQSITPQSTSWRSIINIILPSTPVSLHRSLSLRLPHQNAVHTPPHPHTCYMPRLRHSGFYHPHNIGSAVQIINFLIMKFSPLPCYLVPLRRKYSPQHPRLKHPQPTLVPHC
jgi:hypothetical protein